MCLGCILHVSHNGFAILVFIDFQNAKMFVTLENVLIPFYLKDLATKYHCVMFHECCGNCI